MRMNLRYIFFQILLFIPFLVHAQCVKNVNSFKPGERITYLAYYNWGLIWIHAGNVEFSVKEQTYQNKPVYLFEAYGESLKSYDWIYKVRDKFQSYADMETLQPYWHEKNTSEGGYKSHENYEFNPSERKVISTIESTKEKLKKDTIKVPNCTFDVLTAIYFFRSLDFNNIKLNEKIPISSVIDGKVYSLYIRYYGKEILKNKDDKQYRCLKFSALLVEGTIFKGGEDMFIWVTDDENRVPVLVEAKILVGSVKAYLDSAQGLKYEMKALVKQSEQKN